MHGEDGRSTRSACFSAFYPSVYSIFFFLLNNLCGAAFQKSSTEATVKRVHDRVKDKDEIS